MLLLFRRLLVSILLIALCSLCTTLSPAVLIVAPHTASNFGLSSPKPRPTFLAVATQQSSRLLNFAPETTLATAAIRPTPLPELSATSYNVVCAMGITDPAHMSLFCSFASRSSASAILADPS